MTDYEDLKNKYPDLISKIDAKKAKEKAKVQVTKAETQKLYNVEKKEAIELAKTTKSPYRGGGMPKGAKTRKTIVKEMAKAEMISYIQKKTAKLIATQAQLAFGSQAIFVKEKYEDANGQIKTRQVLIEDEQIIEDVLNDPNMTQGDNYFIITKILPDHNAIKDMLDRAYDKPKQSVDTTVREITAQEIIDELVSDD
jgi:geranylgeranyl pyrophosphate synthase